MESAALLSLFLIGLSYGSSACLLTCMPVLSPLLLGAAAQKRSFMPVLLPFSLGRLSSYMLMALLAFMSAAWVKEVVENNLIIRMVLGSATIASALYILFFSGKKSCGASLAQNIPGSLGFYSMGIGISLSACAPVMTLIATSIHATGVMHALLLGAAFGVGAIAAMLLVYGVLLSKVAQEVVMQFRAYHKDIEKASGVVLLLVGCAIMAGWMQL